MTEAVSFCSWIRHRHVFRRLCRYYEYARALFHKGPLPEIEKTLIEAVRLDPGYTDAYYLLARYYRKSDKNLAADRVLARFRDLKAHPMPSPYGLPRQ